MSEKRYWLHAAGKRKYSHTDLCLAWDVILNGNGYAGKYPGCIARLKDDGVSEDRIQSLERFYKMEDGDVVVLRLGAEIKRIGTVVGDYEWMKLFGKVGKEEWDMQHVRRVKWSPNLPEKLKTYTLTISLPEDTTQELDSKVINLIESDLPLNEEYTVKDVKDLEPLQVYWGHCCRKHCCNNG